MTISFYITSRTPILLFLNCRKILEQKELYFEPVEAACGCFIFSLFDHDKSFLTYELQKERESSIFLWPKSTRSTVQQKCRIGFYLAHIFDVDMCDTFQWYYHSEKSQFIVYSRQFPTEIPDISWRITCFALVVIGLLPYEKKALRA